MKLKRIKREEAQQRAHMRSKRSDENQLEQLQIGGHSNSREALRLTTRISEAAALKKIVAASKPVKAK